MKNKQRIYESPIYVHYKDHFCPYCNSKTEVKKVKKLVNSKSSEAMEFNFSNGDGFMFGDVEFTFDVFFCEKCGLEFRVKDMKNFEQAKINNKFFK